MKTKLCFAVLMTMHAQLFAGGPATGNWSAHEWGTFTSVQGADGVQLEWNPLTKTELPGFVYDVTRPFGTNDPVRLALNLGKGALVGLQRMETPVIYFYSQQNRNVDVTVRFPQGVMTEWYPQVAPPRMFSCGGPALTLQRNTLEWLGVQLSPQNLAAGGDSETLPKDASGSHYFAARDTDAQIVSVNAGGGPGAKTEREKFLFYRGIGFFTAPLQVTLTGDERELQLRNTGEEVLSHLFVVSLRGGQGTLTSVEGLAKGKNQTVTLNQNRMSAVEWRRELSTQMQAALEGEGLYAREAAAMLKTWDDSWFGEEGVRVLYVLSRAWTDRTLPLELSPKPDELARVMVGRAEVITPSQEWGLLRQVVRWTEDPIPASRDRAVDAVRQLGLGRFAEPALRRVLGKTPSAEFNQNGWSLLRAAFAPPGPGKALVQK